MHGINIRCRVVTPSPSVGVADMHLTRQMKNKNHLNLFFWGGGGGGGGVGGGSWCMPLDPLPLPNKCIA